MPGSRAGLRHGALSTQAQTARNSRQCAGQSAQGFAQLCIGRSRTSCPSRHRHVPVHWPLSDFLSFAAPARPCALPNQRTRTIRAVSSNPANRNSRGSGASRTQIPSQLATVYTGLNSEKSGLYFLACRWRCAVAGSLRFLRLSALRTRQRASAGTLLAPLTTPQAKEGS